MTFPYRGLDPTPTPYVASLTNLASITALDVECQQTSYGMMDTSPNQGAYHELRMHSIDVMYQHSDSWHTGQQYLMPAHPADPQAPSQSSTNAETHATIHTAHLGMPLTSNIVSWQHGIPAGSDGSVPAVMEFSAVNADEDKSPFGGVASNLISNTFTEHLQPRNMSHKVSRTSSYQEQASSHEFLHFSEDVDTSDDSWEDFGEDISIQSSTLINLRTTQALAIDERKAYLLRHFVNYIRPCLSLSEPTLKFDGSSTWGEILPSLALSCPGLLHGLMATSALHLAVLHGTSEAVPTKHFMVASKRLHRLLGTPSSRHQLQTLSLCLLLAWYEVMNADHARWIMHLGGASSFLLEHVRVAGIPSGMLRHEDFMVDEQLIQRLTGFTVDYTARSKEDGESATSQSDGSHVAEREWKARLDLFWWYIKMDVYHALLSGDQLLLPYNKWGLCPPRGRIGSVDQVHATIDHLWLVLGRLADFGGKDRFRKQRQVVATGGQWKPPLHFLHHAKPTTAVKDEPGAAKKPPKHPSAPKKGPPMNFYGMMPPPTIPPSMLSSFHVNDAELRKHVDQQKQTSSPSSTPDLQLETQSALAEHAAICEALETWRTSLGTDFNSLPEKSAQTDSPFNPSLRYDDPLVACMWTLYYLGRILLRRYHPHSPPAMMMSANVNAQFTHEDAEMVGRINAGLLENQAELAKAGSINPTLVAALEEVSFVLMFAGVQYQDPRQRVWTIDNLIDLAKSAGWKSAYSVASALETAWTAQGEMGKAPVYERTLSRQEWSEISKYVRVSPGSRNMSESYESEHESRFVSHDRGLITTYADARAYWAIGVLSSADDVQMIFDRVKIKSEE